MARRGSGRGRASGESGPQDDGPDPSSDPDGEAKRAISPVVGTVLMVALTLLLASVIVAGLSTYAEFGTEEEAVEGIGPETATGNPWAGSLSDLIQVSDDEAGASDVRVRVNFTVQTGSSTVGNSLNSVEADVQTGSPDMFSETDEADLEKAVVDTDGDGEGETDLESDLDGWQVSNGGSTIKIEFSGSAYTAQAGDSIIIVFGDVDNPVSPGTYDVQIQTSGDGNWQSGTITVG